MTETERERERERWGGVMKHQTYSSASWRFWNSCHDSVVRGFFDRFLQRKENQRKRNYEHLFNYQNYKVLKYYWTLYLLWGFFCRY